VDQAVRLPNVRIARTGPPSTTRSNIGSLAVVVLAGLLVVPAWSSPQVEQEAVLVHGS
jgi:hypothetical protein